MQDTQRFEEWVKDLGDVRRALYSNWAFVKPDKLEDERERLLVLAGGERRQVENKAALERGRRMARFIRKGRVLTN